MKFSSEESFFDAQPMFVCDQSTLKILDVNNAAVSILGYPKKYFYKKRVVDLGTQKSLNELEASLKAHKGQISDKVWAFKTKEQSDLYFQLSAHLINVTGLIQGEKKSRKVLSTQLNLGNFPLAEIEWDKNLNIIRWSQKAEELFGYTLEEAISSEQLLKTFIHPDDVDRVRKIVSDTFGTIH